MVTPEAYVLEGSLVLQDAGRAAVDNTAVDRQLSTATGLSIEQWHMVRGLTTSGRGGETSSSARPVRQDPRVGCRRKAGTPVLGTAVGVRVAVALTEQAAIPAASVARLVANHRRRCARVGHSDRPDDLAYTDVDVDRPREKPTQTHPIPAITQALQRSKRQRTARDTIRQ